MNKMGVYEGTNENITKKQVYVTDVTLREGDQAPLTSFNSNEKAIISLMLSELGIDVIEVGFGASRADYKNIQEVSKNFGERDSVISSLGRADKNDTIASLNALEGVKNPRIHIFLAMSRDHINGKFSKAGETLVERQEKLLLKAKEEILRAVEWGEKKGIKIEIEFSPEDATGNALFNRKDKKYFSLKNNPDFEFLVEVCEEAIISGATIINVPDTLGNLLPHQTYEFFKELSSRLEYLKSNFDFKLSCHIHNDIAMSSANAIEAIRGGAEYVESTMLGIGERAGNTRTEDILGIITKKGHDISTGEEIIINPKIKLGFIGPISDFVKTILGFDKSLQDPFIGPLSCTDGSGVHNAAAHLYGGSKDITEFGGIPLPEFFSPRGGANQIVSMLNNNSIYLDKKSKLVEKITDIATKKAEEVKGLYVNNIYSLYLEQVKNFHIEKIEINNNKLDIVIRINGDTIELKGEAEGKSGIVKTFVQLLNDYLGKKVIEVKDILIKRKANIHQEFEKFKKRVDNILSEDFLETSQKILDGIVDEDKYSDAKAISQVILDINGQEIYSIAGDKDISIANIKAILEGSVAYLVKNIKK